MDVSIVGSGYVGLVTGACLADRGHRVVCVDVDRSKVDQINAGQPPIHERGLPELLQRTAGRTLRASTDLEGAVGASDLTFITVGTPMHEGRIDLRFVDDAASGIGSALRGKSGYHAVVVKSTVLPGTTGDRVRSRIEATSGKRAGEDFGLGMNPEFLTEGCAVDDFINPGRLVLGGIDGRTHDALEQLYADFDGSVPRLRTTLATAEMIKYASNAVLATMISFSNEIARLCAAVGGVDARDVMQACTAPRTSRPDTTASR
jgi:UDPglucose 6-dehydrogenase/GDP-mannose 6-dehydrogenase